MSEERRVLPLRGMVADRKSTRLNSSHLVISYAVFCFPSTPCSHPLPLHDALPISAASSRSAPRSTRPRPAPPTVTASSSSPFRSCARSRARAASRSPSSSAHERGAPRPPAARDGRRSEEHTSELQSPCNLVCRLLLSFYPLLPPSSPTRRSSDLRRVIPLGAAVDATETSASYRDGILVITLPLVREEPRTRRVPIAEQQRS